MQRSRNLPVRRGGSVSFAVTVHFDNAPMFHDPYLWVWYDGAVQRENVAPVAGDGFGSRFDLAAGRPAFGFTFKDGPGTGGPWEGVNRSVLANRRCRSGRRRGVGPGWSAIRLCRGAGQARNADRCGILDPTHCQVRVAAWQLPAGVRRAVRSGRYRARRRPGCLRALSPNSGPGLPGGRLQRLAVSRPWPAGPRPVHSAAAVPRLR